MMKNRKKPAILVELKYDQSADAAIRQIKEKHYTGVLKDFGGKIVLAGINYDKETKKNCCGLITDGEELKNS